MEVGSKRFWEVFEVLARRYNDDVRGMALERCVKHGAWRDDRQFNAWVSKTLMSCQTDLYRQEKRRGKREAQAECMEHFANDGGIEETEIAMVVDGLSKQDAKVVSMLMSGFTWKDIIRMTGANSTSIGKSLVRARTYMLDVFTGKLETPKEFTIWAKICIDGADRVGYEGAMHRYVSRFFKQTGRSDYTFVYLLIGGYDPKWQHPGEDKCHALARLGHLYLYDTPDREIPDWILRDAIIQFKIWSKCVPPPRRGYGKSVKQLVDASN